MLSISPLSRKEKETKKGEEKNISLNWIKSFTKFPFFIFFFSILFVWLISNALYCFFLSNIVFIKHVIQLNDDYRNTTCGISFYSAKLVILALLFINKKYFFKCNDLSNRSIAISPFLLQFDMRKKSIYTQRRNCLIEQILFW